jgi:hypothetical protein
MMLTHVHVHVLQTENRQDTVRIYHIYLLHMIIGRGICTMDILDHPKPLKTGSFGIHMHDMRVMVLHTRTQRAVVTKILRVSMMCIYLQCT